MHAVHRPVTLVWKWYGMVWCMQSMVARNVACRKTEVVLSLTHTRLKRLGINREKAQVWQAPPGGKL